MVAEAIAAYIKARGIKQTYICKETGLTVYSLSSALNGKRRLSVEEYRLICDALGVTYDTFFGTHLKNPHKKAHRKAGEGMR